MSQLAALVRKDVRIVYRDSFLLFLPAYALVLALVGRLAVPWVPVEHLGLYLAPSMVLFGTLLLGTVLGFTLIEEREQGTWLLLRVLPLEPATLFLYLGAASSLLSCVVSLLASLVYGYPVADLPAYFVMVAVSSLTAPIMMMALSAMASNKIEGLAVSKILSVVLMAPAAIFVLPMPWQLVAAWCPFYWVYLGLLEAYAGETDALSAIYSPGYPMWLMVLAPLVLSAGGIVVLGRRYMRRAV